MIKYQHISTGAIAELIENGETSVKLKDVTTGEVKELSPLTLKRWWKAVETANAPQDVQNALEPDETKKADNEQPEAENANTDAVDAQNVEPLNMSDVVRKLEEAFAVLNVLYFEGGLVAPIITVQSSPRFYGHCTVKKVWVSETEERYEINMGAEYLNRPKEDTLATLLHEMVHLYCSQNGITDTCQNGRYHNKTFKKEAKARDLEIGYDRAIGYSLTTPAETFKAKLAEAGFDMSLPFARQTSAARKSPRRSRAHAYVCPVCGQTVRTTGDLKLICGVCNVDMERSE
jgi:hypothetical protein